MIPKSGYRFSEKIMLQQQARAGCRFEEKSSRSSLSGANSLSNLAQDGLRTASGLILPRVEFPGARHRHSKRPQRVQHAHCAGMFGDHFGQTSISHRAFVEIGADQYAPSIPEPCVHFGASEAPLRLLATEQPAGAMHRGIERGPRFLAVDALDDHGVIAHGAADDAALSRKCRGRAFAHHPQIAVPVALAPGVVVMVMHAVGDCAADDFAHALDDPLAPRIGVAAGNFHGGDVTAPDLAVLVDHGRRDIHAVLAARRLEIARRAGVAEAARAEMHPDPDRTGFVAHQVDIMVAGTDGAELRDSLLPIGFHVRGLPGFGIVEQLMLDTLLIGAAYAE